MLLGSMWNTWNKPEENICLPKDGLQCTSSGFPVQKAFYKHEILVPCLQHLTNSTEKAYTFLWKKFSFACRHHSKELLFASLTSSNKKSCRLRYTGSSHLFNPYDFSRFSQLILEFNGYGRIQKGTELQQLYFSQ